MPRLALTDRFVAGAKTRTPQTDYFDSRTPGLALRVSSAGHKAWTFVFTAPESGKRARLTLGSYPAMPLAAARTRAAEARAYLHHGSDPRAMKARGEAGLTVAELVARYFADPDKARLRSAHEIRRRLDRNTLPVIGHIALARLTRGDIRDVTNPIMRRGAATEAWHTFKNLNAVLRWGVANEYLTNSPMEGMTAPGGFQPGERALSDEEIFQLWHVLRTALAKSVTCQRIIKLCLVTGQRLGEVSGMKQGELDLDRKIWRLPGARTKNAHPHEVPLSELAMKLIGEAIADTDDGDAVFPGADGKPLEAHVVTRAIVRAHQSKDDKPHSRFGIERFSAHDLRRTVLTNLARLGVAPITIAHIANHRSITRGGVTFAHYVQHSYQAEKTQALDLWAERLAAIIANRGATVTPIQRGRRRG